jgi:pimeloyl-ACP methyl ester carboxylesterase
VLDDAYRRCDGDATRQRFVFFKRNSPHVVLVHGAYADGSSWSEVIGRLQGAGLTVTAVQNPLTSLADDVAHTRRVLALQDGPTILAAHSFAGTVITEQDRTTSPELERFLANRMHATTAEIDSGHLSLITHPDQIAQLILEAVRTTSR